MNNLTCNCVPRLDGVSAAELGRLFPEPSITAPLLSLLQESGIDGFNLRSIVVLKDDTPILLLPLFETRFDSSTFVQGWIKKSLKVAGRLIPSLFQPRVLSVGLVVGEWSEIGIDPHIEAGILEAAYKMAFATLQTLAAELKADIVAFYNFNHYGNLPGEVFKEFHPVQYRPCAQLSINFNSLEEFLARFSRAARKDLRRKMRASHEVRVIRCRTTSPFLDRIYKLYLETVARGPMALGAHNRSFFEKICERVPGAEYTLYFVQEELAAFNLLVTKQEVMVDKYFCMDHELGRKHNLYVLSWFENVRTCVERKIPLYCAGQGAEKTKAHLGATFVPNFILFKHRQPVFDRLLVVQPTVTERILSHLGFWPALSPRAAPDIMASGPTGAHPSSAALIRPRR
ncbi:MAG: GNAT family N-acetyltransferase [Syntrophorhabdales bacterium]